MLAQCPLACAIREHDRDESWRSRSSGSAEFETGIDLIDEQHKRLFQYFEDIQRCIDSGDGSQVEILCRGLIDYVLSHLVFEESLMEQAGYPMFEAHRQVHDAFRQRANEYLDKVTNGIDPLKVAREMRTDVGLWLINHIKHEDKHYVALVKKNLDRGFAARMLGKLFG